MLGCMLPSSHAHQKCDFVLYVSRALNYIDCLFVKLKFGSGTSKLTLYVRIRGGALGQRRWQLTCC